MADEQVYPEAVDTPACHRDADLLASIVECSQDAIYSSTSDCRILSWNRAAERMFGFMKHEILGAHASILTPPELAGEFERNAATLLTGGRVDALETVRLTKWGTRLAVALTVSPVRDRAGRAIGASVILRDISRRKQAEEALDSSRELFQQLSENIHEVFWMLDPGTDRILYVSPAFEQIWGRSRENLYRNPSTWVEAIHLDDLRGALEIRNRQSHGEPLENEYRIVRPGKDVQWIRDRAFPVLGSDGKVVRIAGIAEDITTRKLAEQSLQRSESRFRRLTDAGIIGVFEENRAGQILEANGAFLEMLRFTREDLEAGAIRLDRITAPGYEHVGRQFAEQLKEEGAVAPSEFEFVRKNGSRLPALVGLAALPGGNEDHAIGFLLDLTLERQARDALQKSEEQFRQLTDNIREVFWIVDIARMELVYVSPAYEQVWGQPCEALCGDRTDWPDSIHPDDREHAAQIFERQLCGEILDNEYRIVQPSGSVRWIRDRAFPVRNTQGAMVRLAGLAEDITERKAADLLLHHQAFYDDLTDLPNRRHFQEKVASAIADCESGENVAVFFIDLDQFKLVNDTLGKQAGDQLLRQTAARFRSVCGESATLARIGGDEFALAAGGFRGSDRISQFGRDLLAALEGPFSIADRELFVTAGIGISMFPGDGTDGEALERNAEVAMHEAKRAGKSQLRFFTERFTEIAHERLEMDSRLRRALARSEFRLQFQPQFASGRTRPDRMEALIRWYPPDGPAIPPIKFIPIAEQNGLIVPIGTWVLEEACRRCAEWQDQNLRGCGVAVNVSASQFECPDFMSVVARTLKKTGLAPHLLELELTESVFIRDAKASARILTSLRSLGVTIALDDFGTGYSSLSYLQNLPIDALKIDRSFLTEVERRQGTAVLRCFVELAHALGLRVVGEGVETTAQLALLDSLGCDEFQGFLLGRPSFNTSAAEPERGAESLSPLQWGTDVGLLECAGFPS